MSYYVGAKKLKTFYTCQLLYNKKEITKLIVHGLFVRYYNSYYEIQYLVIIFKNVFFLLLLTQNL